MTIPSVRDQLLEHTLVLVRQRGFNGFSYRDLAERVGVKTSSIHYHFPAKEDLVQAAVTEYSARSLQRVRDIDTKLPVSEQARAFLAPWLATAGGDAICLVGMLSTEAVFLPEPVHRVLKDFYRLNEAWLTRLLEAAQAAQHKALPIPPQALAQAVFGALQRSGTAPTAMPPRATTRVARSKLGML
ncbi:TetR family transcriptional regulator [Cupriavidus basilensis OR16]|uniref:TetR family transcriptional regulator n=1 Tax=Cupriavidus basilensis OR16 TaxID=1127483 RepID=H1SGL0_9BURK|nr:TetR/AcrR family transcriptional regulator [Cupriavidus basilensis]EHP38336.1 TetR family transcriptional regulator [Cupriavidus basilensis OR16]